MAEEIETSFKYRLFNSFQELSAEDQELVIQAQQACNTSYAPYSRFCVGAALLLEDGTLIPGSNQENASSPGGLCAERVAIFASGAQHPGKIIRKIAVAARRADTGVFLEVSPCGICRQVMLEFEDKQHQPIELIIPQGEKGFIKLYRLRDLLPFSFGRINL